MLRSPHIDRKSREQFEIRTHKRLIDILRPTQKTIEALNKGLSLPPGVDIKIRVISGGAVVPIEAESKHGRGRCRPRPARSERVAPAGFTFGDDRAVSRDRFPLRRRSQHPRHRRASRRWRGQE